MQYLTYIFFRQRRFENTNANQKTTSGRRYIYIYNAKFVIMKVNIQSVIYQTLSRLIPSYFMICIVNTVVGETATLLNNYHSREKETNIGSLVADSMIDAVSIIIEI